MRAYLEKIVPKYFGQINCKNTRAYDYEASVLYCGKYIFSYGTCIGVLGKKGDKHVLYLNKHKYSKTTSELQKALRDWAEVYVSDVYELSPDDPMFNVEVGVISEND